MKENYLKENKKDEEKECNAKENLIS